MTGYGSGDVSLGGIPLNLEARSVNHRYLETSVRGPRWTLPLESEIRKSVKSHFARGRFDIFIHYGDSSNGSAVIDPETAKSFVSSLTRRSSTSFLFLLVIWILAVLVIPRSAVLLAGRAVG